MEISNKTLAMFLVAAIVISLAGTILSLNKIGTLGSTGYVSANATGTTQLNITTSTSIIFWVNAVDFGIGSVNTTGSFTNCNMQINTSNAISKIGCVGFNNSNTQSDTFIIENNGNTMLNVTLNSSNNASVFIGGNFSVVSYKFTIGNNQSGSCTGTLNYGSWTEFNQSINYNICTNLSYLTSSNTLRLGLNVTIPYDAPQGYKSSTLTVTGIAW